MKLLAILFIFCHSCTTDSTNEDDMNDPADPNPSETILVKRIVMTAEDEEEEVFNFTYNGNKLISISGSASATFTYTNELLTRHDIFEGPSVDHHTIFEYDTNNVLTQYIVYDISASSSTAIRNEITYLPNNEISTKSYSGDLTAQDTYEHETIDTYSNGNLVKRRFVEDGYEAVYLYDTKNGIFKNIHQADIIQLLGHPGEGEGATNNPTYSADDEILIEYIYNANDYPVSSLTYSGGDSTPEFSTQYFYE